MNKTTALRISHILNPFAWYKLLYVFIPLVNLIGLVFRILTALIPGPPVRTQERYTGTFGGGVGKPIENDTEQERRESAEFMTYYQEGDS